MARISSFNELARRLELGLAPSSPLLSLAGPSPAGGHRSGSARRHRVARLDRELRQHFEGGGSVARAASASFCFKQAMLLLAAAVPRPPRAAPTLQASLASALEPGTTDLRLPVSLPSSLSARLGGRPPPGTARQRGRDPQTPSAASMRAEAPSSRREAAAKPRARPRSRRPAALGQVRPATARPRPRPSPRPTPRPSCSALPPRLARARSRRREAALGRVASASATGKVRVSIAVPRRRKPAAPRRGPLRPPRGFSLCGPQRRGGNGRALPSGSKAARFNSASSELVARAVALRRRGLLGKTPHVPRRDVLGLFHRGACPADLPRAAAARGGGRASLRSPSFFRLAPSVWRARRCRGLDVARFRRPRPLRDSGSRPASPNCSASRWSAASSRW